MSVTYDADLEPRPLPSAGITRLRRYYGPLRHPKRPGLSLTGVRLRVTRPHRIGFPVLRSISVYRHAVVNTPVARWALIARGTAYSNRFPVPSGGGLPHIHARSATTLDFSRPAQRSLAITACRLAESPKRPICLEGSDGFVSSPRRFDSYRLERPRCRVGFAPTEDLTPCHAHVWCPRNRTESNVWCPRKSEPKLGMVSPEFRYGVPGTPEPRIVYGVPRTSDVSPEPVPNWVWCPPNLGSQPEL